MSHAVILSASGLTLTVSTCSCMTVTLSASLCSVLHAMNSNLKEMYREQIPTYTGMSGDRLYKLDPVQIKPPEFLLLVNPRGLMLLCLMV